MRQGGNAAQDPAEDPATEDVLVSSDDDSVEHNNDHSHLEFEESDSSYREDDSDSSDGEDVSDDASHSEEEEDESDDSHPEVEESDSSEDEVAPRNTVGDVPLKWYEDEEHIGYDLAGKKIKKKEKQDRLDSFLASADDSKNWRKIYDEYNDEEVELTKDEVKIIRRMMKGKAPHAAFDPYPDYVDWFAWDGAKHPLSSAPEPKRRFIPSKWESKKVVQYVRAIRKGLIKFNDKPKEEPRFYNLWGDDSSSVERQGLSYIPAPKPKLPGHEESYNPSLEYIPTEDEIKSYELMFEEDRPKFIPKQFPSLRSVPAYDKTVKETFDRCLDLYLCPRARKKRLNIDPESLKPKLPSRKDLRPYPTTCYLEYKGHKGPVVSICTEPSGQWISSGSSDGTVRLWEVETGRCIKVWEMEEEVQLVSWNPVPSLPILAVAVGTDVYLLNTGLGDEEGQKRVEEVLCSHTPLVTDDSDINTNIVSWSKDDKHEGIRLKHPKKVTSIEWHRRGIYLSTLAPFGESRAAFIHNISKKQTQLMPFKLHGIPVSTAFHPTLSVFFISTRRNVRAFDLKEHKLIKKLETRLREVSSFSIHSSGDHVIVGSKEGKLCWFDMDLSSQPYRVLKCHPKDINKVAFHRTYPLFASCSDDCTAYVFHGMVYSDLNQNPLIVPLEILRGHVRENGRGILDCTFHPKQPWLFTAGSDCIIKLYCD
ncbi:unnamed protein product [Cuscuta epithymum]|uniref:Ribosome biogenesis protein BOP1 homolog n=1 Tax=Cuscuta epithymum TaxID=186058 RepID=A0AAV0CS14_9ASTE|nr:unnamed protein product [Cuscuta epithymum]